MPCAAQALPAEARRRRWNRGGAGLSEAPVVAYEVPAAPWACPAASGCPAASRHLLPSEPLCPTSLPFFPIEREDSLICHGAALRKATRRVSQLYDAVLAPCGLKVSQHSILSHIARAGAPSMTDLARLLVLDRSALAHNLKPLVRDGYVRTTRDLRDGRSRRVALTDAGCES